MSKGFGSAKPLPGQAGYKVSIADQLERENKEMEERLKVLQERMQQQAQEESESKSGTRWKGAKEKGSIRAYAKDVQEKHKKKAVAATSRPDPSTKATASARRTARENNTAGNFSSKTVENWTISDVGEWLQSMMLTQYVNVFTVNQITGPVLLDISLEDLDYMEVKALGHRKVILKGIEDLRQNKVVTKQLFASSETTSDSSAATAAAMSRTRSSEGLLAKADNPPTANKVHWSVLEPISSNPVSGGDPYSLINGADGGRTGDIDEEAERRAFQEAVMEWRRGGKTTEKGGKLMAISGSGSDATENETPGMWTNPFARPQSSSSGVGVDDGDHDSFLLLSARSERDDSDRRRNQSNSRQGRSLLDGTIDEEKEQAEFRAAVEAWRTGVAAPSQSIKTTAERLAEEMDREHYLATTKLTQYQLEMKHKIEEASREIEQTKQRLQSSQLSRSIPIINDDDDEEDEERQNTKEREDKDDDEEEKDRDDWNDGHLSPCSSMNDSDGDDDRHDPQTQSHVEVSLIESHLNIDPRMNVSYCVSEPDSDEEDGRGDGESKYSGIDVIEIK